ncbi:MAG: transposase [Luteitalea sp.]|nr:transposase [Luteitalea sp.]
MLPRRPRLRAFDYLGCYRYLLTCCTCKRQRYFEASATVEETVSHLRQSAARFSMQLLAWCFMPNHLHVLAEGARDASHCPSFVKDFKQRAGFAFKKRTGERLWQPSYHDRILRDDEATENVIRYILGNPVRAGLTKDPLSYPFSGSEVYRIEEILAP